MSSKDPTAISIAFDGNAETLKPAFWEVKTMITYADFYPWKNWVFFEYGKEIAMNNPKPYLTDNDDGTTELIVEFEPKTIREFRARWWQFLPFLFVVLPLRWFFRLLIGLWTDIFEIEYS